MREAYVAYVYVMHMHNAVTLLFTANGCWPLVSCGKNTSYFYLWFRFLPGVTLGISNGCRQPISDHLDRGVYFCKAIVIFMKNKHVTDELYNDRSSKTVFRISIG